MIRHEIRVPWCCCIRAEESFGENQSSTKSREKSDLGCNSSIIWHSREVYKEELPNFITGGKRHGWSWHLNLDRSLWCGPSICAVLIISGVILGFLLSKSDLCRIVYTTCFVSGDGKAFPVYNSAYPVQICQVQGTPSVQKILYKCKIPHNCLLLCNA